MVLRLPIFAGLINKLSPMKTIAWPRWMSLKSALMADNTTIMGSRQAGWGRKMWKYLNTCSRRQKSHWEAVGPVCSFLWWTLECPRWTEACPSGHNSPPSVSNPSSTHALPPCPFNGTRHASLLPPPLFVELSKLLALTDIMIDWYHPTFWKGSVPYHVHICCYQGSVSSCSTSCISRHGPTPKCLDIVQQGF